MLRAYAWIAPFEMVVDEVSQGYLGTTATGRLRSGAIKDGDRVDVWRDGELLGPAVVVVEPDLKLPLKPFVLHLIDGPAAQRGDVRRPSGVA